MAGARFATKAVTIALCAVLARAAPAMAQGVLPPSSGAPTPATPQVPSGRADENAVRQAQDAFGTTIGRETIGIYSSQSVRGFSPIAAGNARIDGLYYDQVTPPNSRIRRSTSIKIGISAQGYLFPAPTGVVDYALRRPGRDLLASATLSANSFGTGSLEVDAEVPIDGERLSLGLGLGLYANVFANGTNSRQHVEGATLRWRPSADVEVMPFYGRSYIDDDEIGPLLSTAGPYLPPRLQRGRFFGPKWADYSGYAQLFGVVSTIGVASGWRLQAGAFDSSTGSREDIFPYLDDVRPDGSARYIAFSDPPYRIASRSGELRLTRLIADSARSHAVSLSLRARDRRTRNGGSAFLDFGPVRLGDPLDFAEPAIAYGEQNRDRVRQWTGGVAYVGRWRSIGELSLGLSRTDYSKRFRRPGLTETRTRDRPWLYNLSAAAYATGRLAFYGGYTRGLEETGLPPQNAVNRGQALPAIITTQRDGGLRWLLPNGLKLVVGAFDVRKPYNSLNATNLFTRLGDTRNRGVEASLSGTVVRGLDVALGGVLLDPQVVGEARRLGRVGKRPVGVPMRSIDLNLDWTLPYVPRASIDLGVSEQGRVASTVSNNLFIPPRTTVDLGGRYRFRIGKARATLRVAVANVFDLYAYDYNGPGTFDFIPGRQLSAYLAADF